MRWCGGWLPAVLAILSWHGAVEPTRAQIPIFLEFQVNTHTQQGQTVRSVASAADTRFVVVWQSSDQDGDVYGIFLQRFSPSGFKSGTELQVNTYTTANQVNPSVAMAADGRFVVVWNSPEDGSEGGIFGRRFDSAGAAIGAQFQVNSYTTGSQVVPRVAMEWFGGSFVVSWRDYGRDGSSSGVFARRFDSAGAALGGDFQVNAYTEGTQGESAPVMFRTIGGFVIAWQSLNQDGFYNGVFARRFDSNGTPQALEFQVNQYTPYSQTGAAIAPLGTGFLVVWQSTGQDGSSDGIFARRFDSSGAALASEFQINAYTLAHQRAPAVAVVDDSSSFVVAWNDFRGSTDYSVFARGFNGSGVPFSETEFQVNAQTAIFQNDPVVAALATHFVVAWTAGDDFDGSTNGVFARRYRVGVYDVDSDGIARPLTDGVIMLRQMFGFTGAALTAGALGSGCTRCEADAIDFFMGTFTDYDIDGNGLREPEFDGVLLLRYLFGFRGDELIEDAIGDDPSRFTADAIEDHIAARL